jgi:hypothetical protein
MVVAEPGTNSFDLVGGHGSPDATAADDDAPVHFASRHSAGERNDVVGIVVVRIERRSTEVHYLVAGV